MIEELRDHLNAGYSAIIVPTPEEERAEAVISAAAAGADRQVWKWSITEGWCGQQRSIEAPDPIAALQQISTIPDWGALIMRDFHPYMTDPVVQRHLRDAIKIGKASMKTLIFLSPINKIPPELRHDIQLLEFILPSRDELRAIMTDLAGGNNITVDNPDGVVDALCGLTTIEAENALSLSAVKTKGFDVPTILQQKARIIKASGILEYFDTTFNFGDVGGLKLLQKWRGKRGKAFSDKAKEYGLPAPKGVLLMGPPGTGKSLVAKAIAGEWCRPLLRLDMGSIRSSLQGESEENLRMSINIAEGISPSILWLDELEKAVAGADSGNLDSGVGARLLGTLLTWMQEKTSPVFVVATSNDVEALRPELIARFDDIFSCDLPDETERTEIFVIHLHKRNRNPENFDVASLAKESDGLVGREIERMIESAMFDAFDDDEEVTTENISQSIKSYEPLTQTMSDKISRIREWARKHATPASESAVQESGGRQLSLGALN